PRKSERGDRVFESLQGTLEEKGVEALSVAGQPGERSDRVLLENSVEAAPGRRGGLAITLDTGDPHRRKAPSENRGHFSVPAADVAQVARRCRQKIDPAGPVWLGRTIPKTATAVGQEILVDAAGSAEMKGSDSFSAVMRLQTWLGRVRPTVKS